MYFQTLRSTGFYLKALDVVQVRNNWSEGSETWACLQYITGISLLCSSLVQTILKESLWILSHTLHVDDAKITYNTFHRQTRLVWIWTLRASRECPDWTKCIPNSVFFTRIPNKIAKLMLALTVSFTVCSHKDLFGSHFGDFRFRVVLKTRNCCMLLNLDT